MVKQTACNKDFASRVLVKFKKWCLKKGKHPTQENLLGFLIRHSFIDEVNINRFLSLEYYAEELPKTVTPKNKRGVKLRAVWAVEDKLPIKERQIKTNLCHHTTTFRDKPLKFP